MNHVFLLLLFTLMACGQPRSELIVEKRIFPTTFSNSPNFLKIQNQNCSAKHFDPSKTLFNLHLFLDEKSTTVAKDFSPLLEGIYLQNFHVISNTFFNEKIVLVGDRAYEKGKPKQLKICPEESGYASDTVESAALNVSYYIHKTNQRFVNIFPDLSVSPILLSISPSIVVAGAKDGTYMTDNAFYIPAIKTVTILPPSHEMHSIGYRTKYWEVPMVASHEYGHHLFETIYNGTRDGKHTPLRCFGNSMPALPNPQMNATRNVGISDIIDAYNEGFADLISYYTLDNRERAVKGVKCLERTRDIGSPSFYNGSPKRFNDEALQSFFSFSVDNSISSCDEHNYQDSHVLGAIFAYSADALLNELTDSDDEKLKAIVEWVGLLGTERKNLQQESARTFLETTFSLFIRNSLSRFNHKFDKRICLKTRELYPALNLDECNF